MEKDILNLETRKKIYDYISKYPGLHLHDLIRKVNLSTSTVRYHVNYLIKKGLVVTEANKRFTRYYVKQTISREEKEIFNLLRQKVPRKILLLLLCDRTGDKFKTKDKHKGFKKLDKNKYPRPFSKTELIELTKYWKKPYDKQFNLNLHPTTLGFHLKKLQKADLIEEVKVGKKVKYKIKDIEKVNDFLIVYSPELSNDDVNTWLMWSRVFSPINIDSMIDIFYEICPHPYHV